MKRSKLDQLTSAYRLSESAVAVALDLTGARPHASAWHAFSLRLLNSAGIASLGAGVIFFVAANWQDYGVMGRFAILQAAFLVCVGLAMWRPPPGALGRAALILATLLTGALLALLGQSYQTGADLYELFLTWAALSLPFAIAGRSGAQWATWWSILNVALMLYCGWLDTNHIIWWWPWDGRIGRSVMLFVGCVVDLAGAAIFYYLGRTRFAEQAPRWLIRMVTTMGFLFGTVACIAAITQSGRMWLGLSEMAGQDVAVVVAFAIICAVIAAATLRSRSDVFPMALIAASWIAISTAIVVRHAFYGDMALLFVVAAWLIATSTASGFLLMHWVRAWRVGGETSGAIP